MSLEAHNFWVVDTTQKLWPAVDTYCPGRVVHSPYRRA